MDELDAFLDGGNDKRDDIDAFLDGDADTLGTSGPDEIDAFLDEVDPSVFETTLTPAQEQRFQAWKRMYAPNDSGEDYDLRGAFLSGMTGPDENGHWPDTFKKPNHPTFSNESKYAMGEFARPRAGKWDGDIFLEPGRDKATMGEKVGNAAGKAADAVGNFFAAPVRGAKDTKVSMDAAGWLANGNAERLAESIAAREAARQQRPDYVQQLEDDLKAASDQYSDRPDGVRDTLSAIGQVPGAIIRNPTGAMYTALEQLPNMLPSLAGAGAGAAIGSAAGPAGAVAGAVGGMSAGTIATEAGAKVIELLREQNPQLDLRDPEAVAQALEQPGFREEAARRGLTKGAVIAAVDLLTLGIGGKLATTGTRIFERDLGEALTRAGVDVTDPEAVARALRDPDFMATATPRMRRDGSEVWETPEDLLRPSFESMGARNRRGVATALGIETLGEGFGEGMGELASGGDPTLQDVASEMLGSAGMSAAQVGAGALYEGSKSQLGRGATAAGAAPPEQEFEASTAAVGQAAENARRAAEETLRLLTGPVDAPTAGGRPFDQRLLEDGNARLRAEVPSAELPPAAAPGLDVLRQKRDRDRAILGLGPVQPARPAQPATPPTAGAPSLPAPDTATAAPGTETAVTSEDELGQMFDDVLAEELAADSARDVLVGKLETPDPASTAAEDDAIAKLRAKQRKARERYTKEAQLDPAKDDILTAIAKLGGWSREEAKAQGIDPANFGRRGWRIKRIFTTEGDTADGLAERLSQWGYPVLDENGNYDANRLLDAVSEALAGNKVGSAAYNETQAEVRLQEMQDAQDAFLDGETDDYVPEPPDWIMAEGPPDDGYEPIFEGDAYDGLETPQEEQLFDVARAAIESGMPEDEVEAFIERAAIQGLTNDEIRQAIDEARSERGRVQGGSAPARNQGAEDPAGEAGFQLQDYDAKDLKALTQAEKDRAEAKRLEEQKADADEQRGSFTLTGGERPVDEADARGQTGLFDAPAQTAPARLEAWQTEIPTQGLPLTKAQQEGKAGAYSEAPGLLAADAVDAITQTQRMSGQRLYAYVLPAEGGRNGIARLFPDDQTPPAPWELLSGEGLPHAMMTREQLVEKLRQWLRTAPIVGDPAAKKDKGLAVPTRSPTGNGVELLVERYSSGMTRPRDLSAGFENDDAIGIDVGELSDAQLKTLGARIADAQARKPDFRFFIDSGAFSLFRRSLKQAGGVKPMDWTAVFGRYRKILEDVEAAGGDLSRVAFVMPDVVGDQAATLELLRTHLEDISELGYAGADYIIPYQGGEMSLKDFHSQVVRAMSVPQPPLPMWRIGIPSNEAAIADADFMALAEANPNWSQWHILGAVRGPKFERRMAVLRRALNPNGEFSITADANVLRAAMSELKGLTGEAQQEKLAELLARKGDAVTVERTEPDLVDGATGVTAPLPAPSQQLFVEWGGKRYPVKSIGDAVDKWEWFRDEAMGGASDLGSANIVDAQGNQVARISYNGRVWRPDGSPYEGTAELDTAAPPPSVRKARKTIDWSFWVFEGAIKDAERARQEESGKKGVSNATKQDAKNSLDLMIEALGGNDVEVLEKSYRALAQEIDRAARAGDEKALDRALAIRELFDSRISDLWRGKEGQGSAVGKALEEKFDSPSEVMSEWAGEAPYNQPRFGQRSLFEVELDGARIGVEQGARGSIEIHALDDKARFSESGFRSISPMRGPILLGATPQESALDLIRKNQSQGGKSQAPQSIYEYDPETGDFEKAARTQGTITTPGTRIAWSTPQEWLDGLSALHRRAASSTKYRQLDDHWRALAENIGILSNAPESQRNALIGVGEEAREKRSPLPDKAFTVPIMDAVHNRLRALAQEAGTWADPNEGRRKPRAQGAEAATNEAPAPAGVSASGPREVTIKDVPPFVKNRAKVTVKQMWDDGIREAEVSAKDALKDIDREIAAMKKLLACVRKG